MLAAKSIINENVYEPLNISVPFNGPVCPECGSTKLSFDDRRHEHVCMCCGLVYDDSRIDLSADKPVYDLNPKVNPSRVGAQFSYMYHDYGLSTEISYMPISGSQDKKAQWYRMLAENKKSLIKNSKDRNLTNALHLLANYVSQMNFSSEFSKLLKESASKYYRQALSKNLIQGRSIEGIVAACLYIVCRETRVPVALEDIVKISNVDISALSKYYRLICKELSIKVQPIPARSFVPKIRTALDVSLEVEARAISIIDEANSNGFNGGNKPKGIAAASLYLACKELGIKKSQKKVAIASDISEVTIRNSAKSLKKHIGA